MPENLLASPKALPEQPKKVNLKLSPKLDLNEVAFFGFYYEKPGLFSENPKDDDVSFGFNALNYTTNY